jgi:hypothetical protein
MTTNYVVCSVAEDIVIEDINTPVPKGDSVVIPGEMAHRSTDLWKYLSQGKLFRLNSHPVRALRGEAPDTVREGLQEQVASLEREVQQLQGELAEARLAVARGRSGLEGEVGRLTAEAALLRSELLAEKGKTSKLDQILDLLKDPTRVSAMTVAQVLESKPGEEDVPRYFPSQVKPDKLGEAKVEVKEGQADAGPVERAAQVLRSARRKTQ